MGERLGLGKLKGKALFAIENELHWCLDIGFREDDCRVREANSAENARNHQTHWTKSFETRKEL